MSSNGEEVAVAEGLQQRRADAGRERAGALEDKEPRGTQRKLLKYLTGLTECMEYMEASQGRLEEKERLKVHEASVFALVLEQVKALTIQALDVSPPACVARSIAISVLFCKTSWILWCSSQR